MKKIADKPKYGVFHTMSCRVCDKDAFRVVIEHAGKGIFGISWICVSCKTQGLIMPIKEKDAVKGLIEFDIKKGNI